jgi:N,N'-diacetyllegionaminate synthase
MTGSLRIGDRIVGSGEPCYVIAEAGVNHDGDPDKARRLVHAAAEAGADAVKFQMFKAEDVASADAPKAGYQLETTDQYESQRAMLESLELPASAFAELKRLADEIGIAFLCTCYAEDELDYLAGLGVSAFKFASAQIVELPFLAHAATKNRPMLVSTGMATLAEVDEAVSTIREAGNERIVLLQCTTSYPAPVEDANLRAITTLSRAFDLPVGYSDHTLDDTTVIVAVARGAVLVEKHFTLDKTAPGPDHRASLEPGELAATIRRIRAAEASLGSAAKSVSDSERPNLPAMRRSLHAARDIPAGTQIGPSHVALRRPDGGLPPRLRDAVLGATAKVDIPADTALSLDLFSFETGPETGI